MPVNDYLVPLVTCTPTDVIICLDTMLISCCLLNINHCHHHRVLRLFAVTAVLCYTLVPVLVFGIGNLVSLEANVIGYWIMGE